MTDKISEANANILFNFKSNEKSNVESLFLEKYDAVLIKKLQKDFPIYQNHNSFKDFLIAKVSAPFQFIDLQDVSIIDESESAKLFSKTRGLTKLILYDSSKRTDGDIFKFCGWLRMYTWG
jgi:hypothetical protein